MTETYEWESIAWVPMAEWPLEDDDSGQDIANKLAPDDCEWMRRNDGEPGYNLMKFKGVCDDE